MLRTNRDPFCRAARLRLHGLERHRWQTNDHDNSSIERLFDLSSLKLEMTELKRLKFSSRDRLGKHTVMQEYNGID